MMPSRWWIPLDGLGDPHVPLQYVHAAFSRWFDRSSSEHHEGDKPYTISPVAGGRHGLGVEIATLTPDAAVRLATAAETHPTVRLGRVAARVGTPTCIRERTWSELAASTGGRRWRLDFVTPVTFRSGDRASPAPNALTILEGLSRVWHTWSDVALPHAQARVAHAWISDLELRSQVIALPVRARRRDGTVNVTVSAATGHIVIRTSHRDAAAVVGPLLALAEYSGVGGFTRKGLGVTRVTEWDGSGPEATNGREPGGPVR